MADSKLKGPRQPPRTAMQFKERNPKAYAHMLERRKEHIHRLTKTNPELAAKLRELYGENGEES